MGKCQKTVDQILRPSSMQVVVKTDVCGKPRTIHVVMVLPSLELERHLCSAPPRGLQVIAPAHSFSSLQSAAQPGPTYYPHQGYPPGRLREYRVHSKLRNTRYCPASPASGACALRREEQAAALPDEAMPAADFMAEPPEFIPSAPPIDWSSCHLNDIFLKSHGDHNRSLLERIK
jgi:hypothetical protein